MKSLHIKLFIAIPLFFLSVESIAQEYKIILVKSRFDFTWDGTNKFKITCLIAKDRENRQKVEDITYSQRPDTIYEKNGNRYAEFNMEGVNKPNKLEINTLLQLYPYDIKHAKKNGAMITSPASHEMYLISEQYMESDDEMIKAQALKLKKKDDLETVKNIYKFVGKHIKYNGYNPKDVGAKQALIDKKGDCTEYVDLFVALCRACSIPARHILGYISGPVNVPQHSWAEVFLNDMGWVQLELTPNNDAKFEETTRGYAYLTDIRRDPNLNNSHYYLYYYWGTPPTVKNTIEVKEYQRYDR